MRQFRAALTIALAGLVIIAGFMNPATAKTSSKSRASAGARIVKVAASLKGRPYRYGATGPRAFDCSGYTRYVYRKAIGKKIGRSTRDQIRYHRVNKYKKKLGDIIIFTRRGRPYHAAIYAGKKRMWDASRPGHPVAKRKIFSHSYVVVRPR